MNAIAGTLHTLTLAKGARIGVIVTFLYST
jgi:hypothetical protein